jgi:hypothetical protein
VANQNLASGATGAREYLARFGPVASPQWWDWYDRGLISRSLKVGRIVLVGRSTDPLEEDEGEIVQIQTDQRTIAYDREGFWLDPAVVVGTWVHIERVKVMVGTSTTLIDVKIWLEGGPG